MGRGKQLRRQKCHAFRVLSIQAEIGRQARQIALQAISALRSEGLRHRYANSNSLVFLPRVDIWDDPSSSRMEAIFELPGVRRDQILITISQGIMHVRGTRVQERCPGAGNTSVRCPVQELRYGYFGRGVKLPEGIKEDDLTISLGGGLLTVTWPRQAKASPNIPPGEDETSEDCSKP